MPRVSEILRSIICIIKQRRKVLLLQSKESEYFVKRYTIFMYSFGDPIRQKLSCASVKEETTQSHSHPNFTLHFVMTKFSPEHVAADKYLYNATSR